jgi:hypothetical protein
MHASLASHRLRPPAAQIFATSGSAQPPPRPDERARGERAPQLAPREVFKGSLPH